MVYKKRILPDANKEENEVKQMSAGPTDKWNSADSLHMNNLINKVTEEKSTSSRRFFFFIR